MLCKPVGWWTLPTSNRATTTRGRSGWVAIDILRSDPVCCSVRSTYTYLLRTFLPPCLSALYLPTIFVFTRRRQWHQIHLIKGTDSLPISPPFHLPDSSCQHRFPVVFSSLVVSLRTPPALLTLDSIPQNRDGYHQHAPRTPSVS